MELFFQDARFGVRVLMKAWLVSGFIVLLLALGIGANSAMFAVMDGLLLHPVPYPHPQSLVFLWSYDPQGAWNDLSAGDFADLHTRSKTLSDISVWRPSTFVVLGGERPRQMEGARVTAGFFKTLGVKPSLGRTFLPDEDGLDHPTDASLSAIISSRFWKQDLGADPNVLGRTIHVDSTPYTVVGVMPEGFQFWWEPGDVWIPLTVKVTERDYRDLVTIARLNAPRARADAELTAIARSLGEAYPKSDGGWTLRSENFEDRLLDRTFRTRLQLLAAAVGLVLLIACANVTNLLLARAAARTRELAVRISLGATGARLARQLLTESALLGLLGGMGGIAIAWGLIRAIPKFVPAGVIPGAVELNIPVVCFCAAISVLTCVLVGVMPAIAAARSEGDAALKARTGSGQRRQRVRRILVTAEIAAAVVLLSSAWLMTGSLLALTRADPGFDPAQVLAVHVILPAGKYDGAQMVRFCDSALERIRALPGVDSASVGTSLPMATNMRVRFDLEGSPHDEGDRPSAAYFAVGSDQFRVLGIPLKRGRMFTPADSEKAPPVAIVSESFAARYFGNQDPIGQRIVANRPVRGGSEEMVKLEIAGVVGDVKVANTSLDAKPVIYAPHRQNPFTRGVWIVVRTKSNPALLGPAVRGEVTAIDREQPVEQIVALSELVSNLYAQPRFEAALMGAFSGLALLLASIGIYGVNMYAVMQRRNELGIRMALGATPGAVVRDVIGVGMRLAAIGVAIGLAGAELASWWLRSVLVGTGNLDPMAFIGSAVLLAFIAALASYFPARRATRIEPAMALRTD